MKENKLIFIAGTGKSGIAAARLVLSLGGEPVLYNSNTDTDEKQVLGQFEPGQPVTMLKGRLRQEDAEYFSLAVMSPGISLDTDFVHVLDKAGVPVIGELELAYQAARGLMCAITGTNGKTTTTALTGAILRKKYKDVHVTGNIGEPLSAEALETGDESATVIEVSSFMLETIHEFHPHVSAILNITPDHLDRHHTMENYIAAKKAITMNQTKEDCVILNYMDPVLREFGLNEVKGPMVVWFSSEEEPPYGFYYKDDCIYLKEMGNTTQLFDVHELKLLGRHNYENVMAACAMGVKMGVDLMDVIEAAKAFEAVEHRIEFVRERSRVKYYNDSKGTNPDAAIQALKAMPGPVLLIGGGYDKHSAYDEWVRLFPGKVKLLVLMGQTRDAIAAACKKYDFNNITYVDDMNEAVRTCASYADDGDYVLLSPACASWGMFSNFEERGKIFKECVNAL